MARPREFDETTVLEAAMNCFWTQGFEQTSVRDLAERMGITGASLYNAFGDKRSLYRQAFVHYLAQTVRDRVARLEKLPDGELRWMIQSWRKPSNMRKSFSTRRWMSSASRPSMSS
jgi:TetR/AcrR family transcriptional repressor of nem operon